MFNWAIDGIVPYCVKVHGMYFGRSNLICNSAWDALLCCSAWDALVPETGHECMGYTGGGSGVLDQVVVQYPHRYDQVRPAYVVGTTRYDQVRHHG